ncbi:MAG: AAA family ATPase, partial [Candidatus Brocadiales bacterium]
MKFKKAQPKQAYLKLGIYGPPGSGKTATALLLAEGLANVTKKRVAYVDTERGTDFYAQDVNERSWHPPAFDFDAIYSRSLDEVLRACNGLNTNEHGVLVIDSITHIWEAAINAYNGKMTKINTIPIYAWGKIKKPYKSMMSILINAPIHVIICGRQGNEFEEDDTGQISKSGVKMKAEPETPYEPHILARMYQTKVAEPNIPANSCVMYFEKDRTGIFTGKRIAYPTFDTFKPILALLGHTQGHVDTAEESSSKDASFEINDLKEMEEKAALSIKLRNSNTIAILNASTDEEL